MTLLGISVGNLDDGGAIQLPLPFDLHPADELDSALDEVRDRFGSRAVTRAALLRHREGDPMPMLPD